VFSFCLLCSVCCFSVLFFFFFFLGITLYEINSVQTPKKLRRKIIMLQSSLIRFASTHYYNTNKQTKRSRSRCSPRVQPRAAPTRDSTIYNSASTTVQGGKKEKGVSSRCVIPNRLGGGVPREVIWSDGRADERAQVLLSRVGQVGRSRPALFFFCFFCFC